MHAEFQNLPLALITPSLTNPRKHFDQAKLQELANSIASSGVHQPILVRPLPASRMQDTFSDRQPGEPLPEYELIAGERRYRASKLAGVDTIPAMVRDLIDEQVIEVQILENLQRDDLTPMEEAEGYEQLLNASGITREQLAARIGKSRTYVFNRLKLLDLCQEAKAALREGKLDASRAELIARIPDTTLQLKAVEHFTETGFNGDQRMGFRACQQWIKTNVMLRLDTAVFNIQDAKLCPDAGACSGCDKRTGANPDLFFDADSPDICTLPSCFHAKVEAHHQQALSKLRAQGVEIVDEDDALDDHTAVTDFAVWENGGEVSYAQLMEQHLSKAERKKALKASMIDGEVVRLISDELAADLRNKHRAAKAAAQQAGSGSSTGGTDNGAPTPRELERQRTHLQREYEEAWRTRTAQALKPLLLAGAIDRFHEPVMRVLLDRIADQADWKALVPTLDLPEDDIADEDVQAAMQALPPEALGPRILFLLAMLEADHAMAWDGQGNQSPTPTPVLAHLAQACGVDSAAIQAEVQQEMRAQLTEAGLLNDPAAQPTAPPAADAEPKPSSAKATKAPKKGRKLTAEEAKQGIAAAMQGNESAASCGAAEGGEVDMPSDKALWPWPVTKEDRAAAVAEE